MTLPPSAAVPVRPPLLRSAKLFTIDGRMLVNVLDLRDSDVIATAEAPPPAGSIAVLARAGVRMPATVAWVDGRRFGLSLDAPLPDPIRFAAIEPAADVPSC